MNTNVPGFQSFFSFFSSFCIEKLATSSIVVNLLTSASPTWQDAYEQILTAKQSYEEHLTEMCLSSWSSCSSYTSLQK